MKKNKITAVLGPTNTGKTFLAIETMLSFDTGMMGFPLRLLAREVYDKVIKKVDPNKVALITGEEKIIPANAKYYFCTVESMPVDKILEFVGIDEIQMCSDHERGHIFTDRLLNLRGEKLTMFMGSNSMKNIIEKLEEDIEYIDRKRLSKLSYSGHKKISRIERKSAIIAFSAEEVYAIAELIRRQKGGAAIVMGSLSPKTRNSQVNLYQSGDVDYLVATDAIGMGINMDLNNVYFSNLKKLNARGLIISAPGQDTDIISRCFYPRIGVDEDPVTGSAHTLLTPYWSKRLEKCKLTAHQASTRGGYLECERKEDRIIVGGYTARYSSGKLHLPEAESDIN